MWTSIKWLRTFFVLILIAWVLVTATSAASPPPVAENQRGNATNVYQNNQQSRVPGRQNVPVQQQRLNQPGQQKPNEQQGNTDQPWWKNPQWIAAVITGVYAFFAGLQWWSIKRQANVLVGIERPYIFVGESLGAHVVAGTVPYAQFTFSNRGRTVAVITEQHAEIVVTRDLPRRPTYDPGFTGKGQGILYADRDSPIFATHFSRAITAAEYAEIVSQQGPLHLYWFGYVKYEDVFRARHIYRFCFRYFPAGFGVDGSKAYNRRT